MKKLGFSLALIGSISISSISAFAATTGTEVTVTGWVVDSACAYTKGIDKPISPACAKACAAKGSPLAILKDDGTVLLPVSDVMPAESQNSKLLPFAGKRVTVTGKDYVRSGSHGLVIETIAAAK
jgi:hypothetical protein